MILLGVLMLIAIYIIYKLFVDGWLFKLILFCAGWVGLYVICAACLDGAKNTVVTIGSQGFSLAFVIPTVVCILCLMTTRVKE